MLTDDPILRRIEELERAVALRPAPVRRATLLAIAALGIVAGWLARPLVDSSVAQAQQDKGQDLVVRSLKIVDEQGRSRVVLSYDNFGGIVNVLSPEGKILVAAEGDKEGGFVRVAGLDGVSRVFLAVDERENAGFISIRSPKSKKWQAVLSADSRGGRLNLYNLTSDAPAASLWTDESDTGGQLLLYDKAGAMRGDLRVHKLGGYLNLLGSKNDKSHVYLGTGNYDLGGILLLRDTAGKVRAEIGEGKHGGYMFLYGNREDRPHVSMATSEDQRGGYVQIHNNAGQVKLGLGIDAGGNGFIDK